MMTKREGIKLILEGVETNVRRPKGGQHCGVDTGIVLTHPEYEFEIFVNAHRSSIKNRELAVLMFELYLMEILHD